MTASKDSYSKWADTYDHESDKIQWHAPGIVFGIMYPHLEAGQSILDLGTGTGLAAAPFHRAGLHVTGMDQSASMLARCKEKGVAERLIEHDLSTTPWPLDDDSFDHIVSTGVMHMFSDLADIMSEARRVLKPGGLFGFDVYPFDPADPPEDGTVKDGICEMLDVQYQERFYRHSLEYVMTVVLQAGFRLVYDTEFRASRRPKRFFTTLVARKQ